MSRTTRVSRYQKGKTRKVKTNLDLPEQVASAGLYASLHLIPDNHANNQLFNFLQAGCPSCRPTNSVKALKAHRHTQILKAINNKFEATSKSVQWFGRVGPKIRLFH